MNTENVGFITILLPSNSTLGNYLALAPKRISSYCAITESTSIFILLNSSKQHQAPAAESPLKNFPTYK